jgi:hypothetical protein
LIDPQGCSFVLIPNRETKATLTRFYMASGFLCNSILRSQGNRFATFYVAGILLLVLCRGDRENFAQTPASVRQHPSSRQLRKAIEPSAAANETPNAPAAEALAVPTG